jgi:hypothetical protein
VRGALLALYDALRKTDVVTLEATSNAWHLYDKWYRWLPR